MQGAAAFSETILACKPFFRTLVCCGCSRRIERRGAADRCTLGENTPFSSEGRRAATALKPERL